MENVSTISSLSRNSSDLLRYWEAERRSPRWFKDSNETWHQSKEEFLSFCGKCDLYEIDNVLLMVEDFGDRANIHFCIDGKAPEHLISELQKVKVELLRKHEMIFGWILRQNRGLKHISEQLGLRFHGFKMYHGESHGKVLEWQCFSLHRSESFVVNDRKNLLLSL